MIQGTVGIGTATGQPQADLIADVPVFLGSRGIVHLSVDDAEENRFYGFGNGTLAGNDDDDFKAPRSQVSADFSLRRAT